MSLWLGHGAAGDRQSESSLWTQDSTGLGGVSETGDQFGTALATGDFNGDGFDDICIGAPDDVLSGTKGAGAVSCIYGSASGLQATGVGGPHSQLWDENTTGVKGGLGEGDLFAFALISGDFDHDGFAGLCITGLPRCLISCARKFRGMIVPGHCRLCSRWKRQRSVAQGLVPGSPHVGRDSESFRWRRPRFNEIDMPRTGKNPVKTLPWRRA